MARSDLEWQPLLRGARAELARVEVHRIAGCILSLASTPAGTPPRMLSLGAGCAGWILFLAYAAELLHVDRYRAAAAELAEQLKALIGTAPWTLGLLSGLCGIGWLFEHLHRTELLPPPPRPLHRTIKRSVERGVARSSHRSAESLAAVLLYVLERQGRQGLEAVLPLLMAGSEPLPGRSSGDLCRSARARELAALHAVARAARAGGARSPALDRLGRRAARQTRATCQWWAELVEDGSRRLTTTHLSWFAGCLGPAAVALSTGPATRRAGLARDAEALVRCAARLDPDDVEVLDSGLAHGASGIALMFARLDQRIHDPSVRRAAHAWYLKTLDAAGSESDPHRDLSFASGGAGIGLSLLAAVSASPPSWDRVLCLSASVTR